MENQIVTFSNGIRVFNSSAHGYTMEDGTVVPGSPEVAKILISRFEERVVRNIGEVNFVESVAVATEEGRQWLAQFKTENPGVLVVTSFANLSAYADEALIGFIATAETARVTDMSLKRMQLGKFSTVTPAPKAEETVSLETLWSVEDSATKSHGYGGWLSEIVWKLVDGRDVSNEKPERLAVARAMHQMLENTTPKELEFGEMPENVEIIQKRYIYSQQLSVEVRFHKQGDYRSWNYTLYAGDKRTAEELKPSIVEQASK